MNIFTISGESQSHEVTEGLLGTIQRVGNLQRMQVKTHNRTGLWDITINSEATFTVKVTGEQFSKCCAEKYDGK